MPVPKKQHTTATNPPVTASSTSSQDQVEPTFHQRLREHIRDATRSVMEEIMQEELTQFLGAEWGEYTPQNARAIATEALPVIWQRPPVQLKTLKSPEIERDNSTLRFLIDIIGMSSK